MKTYQGLGQEIDRVGGGMRKQGWERALLADGQSTDIISRPSRGNGVELVKAGGACGDCTMQWRLVSADTGIGLQHGISTYRSHQESDRAGDCSRDQGRGGAR